MRLNERSSKYFKKAIKDLEGYIQEDRKKLKSDEYPKKNLIFRRLYLYGRYLAEAHYCVGSTNQVVMQELREAVNWYSQYLSYCDFHLSEIDELDLRFWIEIVSISSIINDHDALNALQKTKIDKIYDKHFYNVFELLLSMMTKNYKAVQEFIEANRKTKKAEIKSISKICEGILSKDSKLIATSLKERQAWFERDLKKTREINRAAPESDMYTGFWDWPVAAIVYKEGILDNLPAAYIPIDLFHSS